MSRDPGAVIGGPVLLLGLRYSQAFEGGQGHLGMYRGAVHAAWGGKPMAVSPVDGGNKEWPCFINLRCRLCVRHPCSH